MAWLLAGIHILVPATAFSHHHLRQPPPSLLFRRFKPGYNAMLPLAASLVPSAAMDEIVACTELSDGSFVFKFGRPVDVEDERGVENDLSGSDKGKEDALQDGAAKSKVVSASVAVEALPGEQGVDSRNLTSDSTIISEEKAAVNDIETETLESKLVSEEIENKQGVENDLLESDKGKEDALQDGAAESKVVAASVAVEDLAGKQGVDSSDSTIIPEEKVGKGVSYSEIKIKPKPVKDVVVDEIEKETSESRVDSSAMLPLAPSHVPADGTDDIVAITELSDGSFVFKFRSKNVGN